MFDDLVHRQVDEILEDVESLGDCECIFLYAQMAASPEGMPNPEEFGMGNIPVCDFCGD